MNWQGCFTLFSKEVRRFYSVILQTVGAPVVTALLVILAGLFAAVPYSPQEWATLVVRREFYAP